MLVIVNVALLAGLFWEVATPSAKAQTIGGGSDYIMITGKTGSNWDAVYVIDLGTRRMAAWRFEKGRRRMIQFRGRELTTDFGRRTRQPGKSTY